MIHPPRNSPSKCDMVAKILGNACLSANVFFLRVKIMLQGGPPTVSKWVTDVLTPLIWSYNPTYNS